MDDSDLDLTPMNIYMFLSFLRFNPNIVIFSAWIYNIILVNQTIYEINGHEKLQYSNIIYIIIKINITIVLHFHSKVWD